MKKFLLLVFVFQFMMLNPNSVLSQCNTVTPGTIVMKRDSCISNKILLELQGHTTGTDVRYVWQIDDGSGGGWAPILGLDSFATRYSISMFDPQGKSIRVLVYCNSSGQFAYTTLFKYLYLDKRLEFSRIVCNPASSVGYDIYTKLTALNNINPITDTIYDIIPTYYAFTEGRDSMNFFDTHDLIGNVPYQRSNEFNLGGIFQRQVVFNWFSYCNENPLTQVPPRDMKWALDSLKLGIKNVPIIEDEAARDCVNDSLTLKLDLDDSFARAIQVTWFKKNVATNQTTTVGTSAKLKIRANVPLNDTFYASLSACGVTELSFPIVINNSVGTLTNTLLCTEDSILFDYSSRLQNINIFNPVYQFSLDSGALWFDIPEMLILDKRKPYRKVVKNNEIIKYRVVTKFCLESTDGVDTSNVVTHALSLNPKFEMTYFDCSNPLKKDSLKIKLNDSGSYTSYPIFSKKWYRQFHYDPIAVDVSSLFTGDSIMVKGQIGRNTYSIQYSLCPTSYNSLLLGRAGIFYPINPVADILSCQDSLTYRMLNDSTYLYDDTSTTKINNPREYIWYLSFNNANYNPILSATNPTYKVPFTQRSFSFKRGTYECGSAVLSSLRLSEPSSLNTPTPTNLNGRADLPFKNFCLSDSATITVSGAVAKAGSPIHTWQFSYDDITWFPLGGRQFNNASMRAFVGKDVVYYRRITIWCPSLVTDSTASIPLFLPDTLPWNENLNSHLTFGQNNFYNCFKMYSPDTNRYGTIQIPWFSNAGTGKNRTTGYTLQNPALPQPEDKIANNKLVVPSKYLYAGKTYRFSFFFKSSGAVDKCWDSLFVTVGKSRDTGSKMPDIRLPKPITNFEFDQWSRYWVDFSPIESDLYSFAVNVKEDEVSKGNFWLDDFSIKEVFSCQDRNPTRGTAEAPQKINDSIPENGKEQSRFQYAIGDTLMITYAENSYDDNFDYFGMTYSVEMARRDLEYHIWEDFAPIPNSGRNCFFQNFNNTHTINILATDTTTFYRIKAVCTLEDNPIPVYSDSVRINGTHYISYCENFESLAPNDGPLSHPNNNNLDITARGQNIPLGWSSYGWFNNPLNLNNDPFAAGLFPLPDPPAAPWFEPNSAFKNSEVGIRANSNSRKVLVMPGVRLHKGKGYRISFKYNDNRSLALPSNIYGGINNRIDSLYITVAKHYMADMNRGNFNVNTTPCRVSRVQVNSTNNIYESSNEFRFNEYTFDFIPDDTATYYFGINAHDPTMVNPYRFMIDYVCIDTLELSQKDPLSNTCYDKPKFNSQYMRIKINPDAKTFPYAQRGTLWCVGMSATICLEFTNGEFYQYWRAGWKYRFERTTDFGATWSPFGDSSNCIHYTMTSKPQDFRLILYNECNEGDTIGPFNVGAPNNTLPWIEEFEGQGLSIPSCWDIYTSGRVSVSNNIKPIGLGPKSKNNYMNINNSSPDAPANPKFSPYTVVPPTMFAEAGKTYRFSFWYRNNEKALPQDSIRLTYSYSRPQQTFDSVLPNRRLGNTPNDIVKNYNTDQYEYYTSEFKSLVDTNVIFKVQIHNATNKNRIYDLHLDDFEFKPKFDNDLVVIRVDSPRVRCESLLDSVTVRVMNIGNLPQSNFNVRVSADGGPIASAVFTGTLNSNEIGIVTIKNVVLNSAVAGNLLKVWSDIPGDQDKWDDTLLFPIVNYPVKSEPVYTLDSFCYNSEASVSFGAPNLNTVWYRNEFDLLSIQTNNTMTIPNLIRDTSFYVAYTSGFQRFTNPINTATSGVPGSSNLNLGLRFNNYHFKDLAITGFDVYVTQIGTFAYQLIDRTGTVIYNSPIINFTSTGLQEIRDLNIIVPPGFDYTLVKSSGTANLAIRNNYNFVNRGIPNLIDITASTAAGTNEFRQFFYFYNISFVDRGCETKRYRVDMRVRKLPEFTLKDTIRVCRLPQYQVCAPTAPPGFTYTYNWRHRPTDNSSCVIADSTRLYHLNITDQFGCKFIDSTRIIVDPSPVFDIKDTGICFGNQSIVVSSALSPNENFFVWSTGRTTPSLTISIPGIYTLTAVNLVNFCEATDTFKVVGYPLPEFSLGNDRVFCTNSNDIGVMLPPSLTYLWDNGSTNKFRPISASGRYSVIGTDLTTGCRNFDTIQATLVANPTLDLGPNDTVCGVNKVLNGPIGNFAYLWSTSNTSRSQLVSLPGRYYLTIIDKSFGCSAIDSIDITFRKPLELNMRKKIDTCISNFELRSPIVSSSYQWTGPVSSNASSINVDKSGVYKLTVNDGCYQVSDSTEVILNTSANLNIDLLPDSVRACRTASLMASSNPNGAQFNWNTGAKSNGINVNRTGSYSVSLFNSCGNITRSSYVIIDTLPVANFNMLSVIGGNKIPFSNRSLYAQSYLWDFGDGKTSREKNPIHTYLSSGVFQVTLTVTNSCGQSTITRKTVTVKSVGSGIKESEQALLFLYPNPTTAGQNTHLELTNIKDGMYSMKIFDLNGRLVHSQDKKALANKLEMNFVLEEISSAQYLIEITNEDNDKYSTRLQIK